MDSNQVGIDLAEREALRSVAAAAEDVLDAYIHRFARTFPDGQLIGPVDEEINVLRAAIERLQLVEAA